ncbi:hypothetical protein M8J76_001607 [Diaphorina citri]|nr:hypothetical protein M8J76_001607 [Diaphorina citri]
MKQQFQQLDNRLQNQQQHDDHLQHQHEHCLCETYQKDRKHLITSSQIGHRYIPSPVVQPSTATTVPKYNSERPEEELNPRVKTLPYETTTGLYHDHKIVERDPLGYYNRENVLDCDRNPNTLRVHPEPTRPFTTSEYEDRYRSAECRTVSTDPPLSRPDQCLAGVDTLLSAAAENLPEIGPATLDVMCDIRTADGAMMKILHPYISVYDSDFVYPTADSPFTRYRRQIIENYWRNKTLNMFRFTLRKPRSPVEPLDRRITTGLQPGETCVPEENLNNPNFGALQIVPKFGQPVPNFGLVSETRGNFVDPKKMLGRSYRCIASYGK